MDKPGVQGLTEIAHSQEIEGEVSLVAEVLAGEGRSLHFPSCSRFFFFYLFGEKKKVLHTY